jgi:acyl-CoA dehydrogenase
VLEHRGPLLWGGHGGLGHMRESEVERHYRDSRILGIGIGRGTNEIMTEVVAKLLLR